jgi:hypothetical protein
MVLFARGLVSKHRVYRPCIFPNGSKLFVRGFVAGLGKPAPSLSGRFRRFETFTKRVRDSPSLPGLTILKVVDNIGSPFARRAGDAGQHALS